MGKRTIKLGTWNDKPIEWIVLKEEDFGTLVISAESIGGYQFRNCAEIIQTIEAR